MACDILELYGETKPWNRYGHKIILAMRILVLCDVLNGAGCAGSNDVTALAFRANCLAHLSESQLEGIEIQLLCQLFTSVVGQPGPPGPPGTPGPPGPGGQQQVYVNAGNPNGVVLHNSVLPALCIDTVNSIIWSKQDGIASNTGWGSP